MTDRAINREKKPLRNRFAIVTSLHIVIVGGCANLASPLGHGQSCCPDDAAGCVPLDGSVVPPNASIHVAHRCVDPLLDDAVPAPVGTYVGHWRGAMSDGAQDQHWFISRNEWFDGGNQLGPHGKKHVERIAQCFFNEPRAVVIENEPVALEMGESYDEAIRFNQQLQVERRNAVATALAESGVPDPNQWVVFADDRTVGVRGLESPQIYNSQFGGIGQGQGNRGGIGRGQGGLGGGIGGGLGGIGGGIGGGGGFGGGGIF